MPVPTALADVRRIARGPMRRLFVGQFLKDLGAGMTLALLVVYLTEVRDLPVGSASLLLAWQALLALGFSPVTGSLVDRLGPRPVVLVGALITAAGVLGYGFVQDTLQAFVATTVVAIGGAAIWGPLTALTARLVEPADRPAAFGFAFMLTNLGLGLGGLVGASIVDIDRPVTFQVLYTLTAVAYLALCLAVLSMGQVGGRPNDPDAGAEGGPEASAPADQGSWRDVLRDRRLLRFGVVGLLLLTAGYGSLDAGVALYITDTVDLPVNVVGLVFAANTAVIVAAQLFVLARTRDRRRSSVLAAVGLVWAVCWLLFAAAAGMPEPWLAAIACVLAMSVFALGETLWSPVAPALVNDLAPEHLRGRYNSFLSLLFGTASALGPLVVGLMLSRSLGVLWALLLAAGCGLGAVLAARMGRVLTPEQEGLPASQPAPGQAGGSS